MERFNFICELCLGNQSINVDTDFDAEDISQANEIKSDFRDSAKRLGFEVLHPVVKWVGPALVNSDSLPL